MLWSDRRDSSLLKAVNAGDLPRTEWLLDRGADIETRDESKWNSSDWRDWRQAEFTPLAYAIESRDQPMIRLLIAHGANINAKTPYDERFGARDIIVATAIEVGDIESVRLLLQNGAKVDVRGGSGTTPLMLAAQDNRLDIVRLLIAHGADVNARDDRGFTVLNFATKKSRHDKSAVTRLLKNAGAH